MNEIMKKHIPTAFYLNPFGTKGFNIRRPRGGNNHLFFKIHHITFGTVANLQT